MTRQKAFTYLLCLLLAAVAVACKKDKEANYALTGIVRDGDTGEALSDVTIAIEKQVINNGVFGENFSTAATARTNTSGAFSATWSRENFAALRLIAQKSNYIDVEQDLDIDAFKAAPDYTLGIDYAMHKEAFVNVRLRNTGNSSSQDVCSFTFLNAEFDCNCCSNAWRTFEGASVDTAFTCRVYGDRWIKYQVQTSSAFNDSIFVDSIYCSAFVTSVREIDY